LALALLLLAGSPEAARAGGILLGVRILFGPLRRRDSGPSLGFTLAIVAAGVLLAAPQLLPTLLLAREAGRGVTGLALRQEVLPGLTGLVLRYVSHTPTPSLALAALPLLSKDRNVRIFGCVLGLCLVLQWGRGPLAAPGALPLASDLALCVLAGLSLSAQWRAREQGLGRRLRAYFLFSCLASSAALSVSAATLGPLPETLAPAVGVLALSLIFYFSLAASPSALRAGLWLLPLTVAFLLQPDGRRVWDHTPTRVELFEGTSTAQSIDRAMGSSRGERSLSLVREWPREEGDLVYANLSPFLGRRSANGYDPMVPSRTRKALGGMSAGGWLPRAFFRTDPARLEVLGVRWVQVPTSALTTSGDGWGVGDALDVTLEAGRPRVFPLPIATATEIRLSSWLSDAVTVPQDAPVARVKVRLASGRSLEVLVRAGGDTAEWAYDRPDVRALVAHRRPLVLESFPSGTFEGHHYKASLPLSGRYLVDGLEFERLPGEGRFTLSRVALFDAKTGRATAVSLTSSYVSDAAHFREAANTPAVKLFELPQSLPHAHVAERLKILPDDASVLHALEFPTVTGFDPWREALIPASEAGGIHLGEPATASRADVVRAGASRLDVDAIGPGVLVMAESWDAGWSAKVDEREATLLKVNYAQIGVVLGPGGHFVSLRHRPAGFVPGLVLAALGALSIWAVARRVGEAHEGSGRGAGRW
jgi:hypothetical protein